MHRFNTAPSFYLWGFFLVFSRSYSVGCQRFFSHLIPDSSRRNAGASLNSVEGYFSGARRIEPGYPAPWLTTFSLIQNSFFYFKSFWLDSCLRKEGINLNRLIFKKIWALWKMWNFYQSSYVLFTCERTEFFFFCDHWIIQNLICLKVPVTKIARRRIFDIT